MASFETIVRPVLPVDPSPAKTAPSCQQPASTTTAKFGANASTSGGGTVGKPPKKTFDSQWSYSVKTYQTKIEKEKSGPKKQAVDVVTSSTTATDVPIDGPSSSTSLP